MWKWEKNKRLQYEDIFKELDKENIRYLLIGGIAVILYGVPRSTGDVDLMLYMSPENILKFVGIMRKMGYKPKVPVQPEEFADEAKRKVWQEEKNMKVFSFQHPDDLFMVVDIMINSPIDFETAYQARQVIDAWGIKLSVISKEDLIKLKKIAGRSQDLSDIIMLERVEGLRRE